MQKKCMAVILCACMALAAVPMGGDAHAAPPEDKGHGNSKEKKAKHQDRGGKSQGSHGQQGKRGNAPGRADEGGLILSGITVLAARDLATGGRYTGYKALPPGIAKNLARGKPLPPGIAKKVVPAGMLKGLPVHPGYEWQVAGRDLVLIQAGTLVIADVLRDVFD